jgi:hypothetical protein
LLQVAEAHTSMLVHVAPGDGIRYALIAQDLYEPVEQGRGVTRPNRRYDPLVGEAVIKISEVAGFGHNTANRQEER